MRNAARKIIKKQGAAGLSFRALATSLGLSHSAPLYHFGTIAGLLGAVAAEAFAELAGDLEEEREWQPASKETLPRLAQRYASWAMDNRRLYEAIHSPLLWGAVQPGRPRTSPSRQNPPLKSARDRARPWIEEANEAREMAFHEFVQAAMDDPSLANNTRVTTEPGEVARMVTTLVDGYLFQFLNEYIRRDPPQDEVKKLVGLALRGVQTKP